MKVTIVDNIVHGGPPLAIPGHISLGQHIIDKLKENLKNGDGLALIKYDTGEKMTYKQLLQEIVDAATGFKEMGLKKGDVIAICSENKIEYITAFIAIICCGATVTPFSSIYTGDEIKQACSISQPSIILGSEIILKRHLKTFKTIECLKRIIQLNGTPEDDFILPYQDIMVHSDVWKYEAAEVMGWNDIALILYSSGTTGMPKGIMITHFNSLYEIAYFQTGYSANVCQNMLTILPWYHTFGLHTVIIYLTLKKLVVFMSGFQPDKYLNAIQEYKINVVLVVPSILILLVKSPIVLNYDLSSLKVVFCGAAPLSLELVEMFKKRFPNCIGICQVYGMTELTLAAMKDLETETETSGSCGYPLPGIKIKVVDVVNREKLGPNKDGEICVKGPIIMKGYVNNDSATRDIIDEEGYLKTGDVGHYDDIGRFYIVDRAKELIKYKGNQVSPAYVEQVVLQHNEVAECCVVGIPDEIAGELPVAFVVLKPEVNLTKDELLQFTDERLSRVSRLRGGIIFINEMPKTPTGKVLRRLLKEKLQDNNLKI